MRKSRPKRRRIVSKMDCFFCQKKLVPDYKEPQSLSQFISDRGKINSRIKTGVCAKHQRRLTKEVKRARYLALLPYLARVKR